MIKFKNKNVAEKYDPKFETDQKVIIPGIYKGMLSGVTLSAANRMMRTKTNLLVQKDAQAVSARQAAKEDKPKEKELG